VSEHLDLDALADVLAGEASPEHLQTCAPCQARLAELSAALPAVNAALAALPVPEPPADLDLAVTPASVTVLPVTGERRRVRWLPALAGIAAAAVLITGGVLYSQRSTRHPTTDLAGVGAAHYTVSSTGTDYAPDGKALRAQLPTLLGVAAPKVLASKGATTTRDSTALSAPAPSAERMAPALTAPDPLALLRTTTGLASCLASLTDPSNPGLPLALDYAQFQGQPALVVVLPADKADKVDVFVVGAGCAQADAKVLFFTRLPKP
jgi:hypothetical protein